MKTAVNNVELNLIILENFSLSQDTWKAFERVLNRNLQGRVIYYLTDVSVWVWVQEPAEDSCKVLPNLPEGRPSTWMMKSDCNPRLGKTTLPSSGQKH